MKGFLVLTLFVLLLTTAGFGPGAVAPPAVVEPAVGELVGGINQTCLLLGLVAGIAIAHANPWPLMGAAISGSAAGCW